MNFKTARLLLISAALIAGPAMAQNAAVVNGVAIPSNRVDELVKQITAQPNGPKDTPELREKVKERLIETEIFTQTAEKNGLGKTKEVKEQMELARQSILTNALFTDYLSKNPISDADITAEYDRFKAQAGDKEYHVRHILVGTEDEAKAIIAKLKAGASFEELAKQSKDTASANNGGDLDWTRPDSVVKPFADAMVALQKGQMTETPVKSQYGYHVIRLDDVRPLKIPALADVKPQIEELLKKKKVFAYQEELRKKATVK